LLVDDGNPVLSDRMSTDFDFVSAEVRKAGLQFLKLGHRIVDIESFQEIATSKNAY
jgi:hypothetical protein